MGAGHSRCRWTCSVLWLHPSLLNMVSSDGSGQHAKVEALKQTNGDILPLGLRSGVRVKFRWSMWGLFSHSFSNPEEELTSVKCLLKVKEGVVLVYRRTRYKMLPRKLMVFVKPQNNNIIIALSIKFCFATGQGSYVAFLWRNRISQI